MKRTAAFFAAGAALVALAGCGGDGGSSADTTTGPGTSSVLVGAGSTFVFPLVSTWSAEYSKLKGVTVTYGPIGSGGGIGAITSRSVDFGASDAPLTPDQATACDDCLQIPWALAGTSIPYNLPGVPDHLKLTGDVIADIYLGTITNWNDSRIAKLNPGVSLPDLKITPIFRSDGSGTTYNFTDYLGKVSPAFKSKVGNATQVDFPVGIGGKGSSGMAGALTRTEGGIGYVDVAYATEAGLAYAAIQNRAGAFTLPDINAVEAAAKSVQTIPPDNAVSIVDPPASAKNAYPISTFSYAIVPQSSSKTETLKAFLTYAVTTGPAARAGPAVRSAAAADRRAGQGDHRQDRLLTGS